MPNILALRMVLPRCILLFIDYTGVAEGFEQAAHALLGSKTRVAVK
ncbi:hypothetical protein [Pseudoalteromonas distincta]